MADAGEKKIILGAIADYWVLPEVYMVMVSGPGLSRFIMNLLFALKPAPVPIKSFTDDRAAKSWLQQFV